MVPDASREDELIEDSMTLVAPQAEPWTFQLSYSTILIFGYLHLSGIYGLYLCFTSVQWATILFSFLTLVASILGVTAGAHRLWAHRSYKANLPLQIILMLFHSLSGQYTVINWVKDHRLHHKHADTDADPHNATRGLFYSHVGWLLVVKHPEVRKRGRTIDLSDLLKNPVLSFQRKYSIPLVTFICYIMPTIVPMYFWGEIFNNAWHTMTLRFCLCNNFIWLVNSAAHAIGSKPYDQNILATQNLAVILASLGEGFHNYHHVFPFDYKAAELGNKLNLTTKFIDFFAWIGWAYDLKTASPESVVRRAERTGDGSWFELKRDEDTKADSGCNQHGESKI